MHAQYLWHMDMEIIRCAYPHWLSAELPPSACSGNILEPKALRVPINGRTQVPRKTDGFDNKQFFVVVVSDEFLSMVLKKPMFRFLTITYIGCFPAATHHYRERQQGCQTAVLLYSSAGSRSYSVNGGKMKTLFSIQIIVLPPSVQKNNRTVAQPFPQPGTG